MTKKQQAEVKSLLKEFLHNTTCNDELAERTRSLLAALKCRGI